MLCYREVRNPVSHALVHNSSQVYFQLFFVVFNRKSYKSTPLQSIKHQHPTGNISINFLNIVAVFVPEIAFVLLWMLSRNLSYRGFQNNTRSRHYLCKYF